MRDVVELLAAALGGALSLTGIAAFVDNFVGPSRDRHGIEQANLILAIDRADLPHDRRGYWIQRRHSLVLRAQARATYPAWRFFLPALLLIYGIMMLASLGIIWDTAVEEGTARAASVIDPTLSNFWVAVILGMLAPLAILWVGSIVLIERVNIRREVRELTPLSRRDVWFWWADSVAVGLLLQGFVTTVAAARGQSATMDAPWSMQVALWSGAAAMMWLLWRTASSKIMAHENHW